jgi:hypothetical protein
VSISLHLFASGRASEGEGGASILDVRARNGRRQSVFRSYVFPYLDRPNLTVLAGALVTRVTLQGNRVTGVDGLYNLAQTYRSRRADEPVEPTEASPGTQPPPQRAGRLLITGVALSIDNLAVGFARAPIPSAVSWPRSSSASSASTRDLRKRVTAIYWRLSVSSSSVCASCRV